jgi:hypothetical protein
MQAESITLMYLGKTPIGSGLEAYLSKTLLGKKLQTGETIKFVVMGEEVQFEVLQTKPNHTAVQMVDSTTLTIKDKLPWNGCPTCNTGRQHSTHYDSRKERS